MLPRCHTRLRVTGLRCPSSNRFKVPIDLRGRTLQYASCDPTYFTEILRAESGNTIRLAGAPADCTNLMNELTPTMETIMLVQALDRTQTAGDGLGVLFAETVELRCP
jgi:ABC-type uncharacterized transport system substrate-binding protein